MLSNNATLIGEDRYFMDGENWAKCTDRVGQGIAQFEEDRNKYIDAFGEMIHDLLFLPGGRILRNTGRPKGSLLNCNVLPVGDSAEEIWDAVRDAGILWCDGGGVGFNFSTLRPKGWPIKGRGGQSSGLVSFMEVFDAAGQVVESGGSRRAAAKGDCDISHPEIERFLDAKLQDGRLSCFNISVNITQKFLEAVMADANWELQFNGVVAHILHAKDLWDRIIQNMIHNGDPGLNFWDNLVKNNSYYFAPIVSTNPCGEAPLSPYGSCCLGSLVLSRFVDSAGRTKWRELDRVIPLAVRFLDNVLDINRYSLEKSKQQAHRSRRIGLGYMGLAEYLFKKKIRYGTAEAVEAAEKVTAYIKERAYIASVDLAKEKGSFPSYDSIPFSKASFIRKNLPPRIQRYIRDNGIRNVSLLALAPTGTISLLADTTSGIEPLFSKAYVRKDRVGERVYIHPLLREALDAEEEDYPWLVDSNDLTPVDHFEMQVACQKHIDGAVSKTINLPSDCTGSELSDLLLSYLPHVKGCTVYRDGSRDGQPLNHLRMDEVIQYLEAEQAAAGEESVQCATGKCEI